MNIQITSRAKKASETLQETIRGELDSLEKYSDKITSCHVILDHEHENNLVEINCHTIHHQLGAKAKDENLGKALDEAIEKMERQLKKVNEKIKDHKAIPGFKEQKPE